MIAAVRSLLDNDDNAEDGEPGSGEGDTAVGADTIGEDDLPTIYGEVIGLDAEVVTCGGSSIYHYPDEDGRPACRHDAEARTATRRALEPHHRPCRDCFDTPAAGGE